MCWILILGIFRTFGFSSCTLRRFIGCAFLRIRLSRYGSFSCIRESYLGRRFLCTICICRYCIRDTASTVYIHIFIRFINFCSFFWLCFAIFSICSILRCRCINTFRRSLSIWILAFLRKITVREYIQIGKCF